MITRTFKLCLNAGTGSAPFINVSQTDRDETWLFELYTETGERYIPSSGAIIGIKADGHGIANTGTVDSEGRVVITETEQMTAAAGRSIFELSIDGLTHGTANFIVNVEKKPIDGAIMSDSDLSLISEAVDSAAVIVEVIGDSDPSEVIGEHVDAWLDAHPEATTTVQDGAITAPKLNNSLWDKLLVSEEVSGNPASFEDGADDVPVSSLKVALEPIQTGTGDPSPSNVRPIVAANGKNLYNASNLNVLVNNGITATVNGGTITLNGTATSNAYFNVNNTGLPSGTYTLSYNNPVADSNVHIALRTSSNTYYSDTTANSVNRIATSTGEPDDIIIYVTSGTTLNNFILKPMLETGSSASAYQPYQGIMVTRTGKNLLPMTLSALKASNTRGTWNGNTYTDTTTVTFRVDTDSNDNVTQIVANGTGTAAGVFYIRAYDLPNGSYIFSGCPSGATWNTKYRIRIGDKTDAYINDLLSEEKTITVTNGITLQINTGSGYTCNNLVFKPMIRYASVTDSTFEPYISTSYPYSLGQTVYGGTVDLATGVLTVTHGIYTVSAVDSLVTKTGFIRVRSTNPTEAYASSTNEKNAITNNMVFDYVGIIGFNGNPSVPFSFYVSGSYTYFVLPTTVATDLATANAWFANNQTTVVYPLATPTTVQLTPTEIKTLLGYNNISSSGTVDVIYHADTKLYVDKMTAVDNNIIAPTEETFTATRNYTVNDLVIVADTLYKVTSNIATGSAITPNSNVQQTTLSALIKALS